MALQNQKSAFERGTFTEVAAPAGATRNEALVAVLLECKHCGKPFQPRRRSGGKPQRFCSSACRFAFHQRGQRDEGGPTYNSPSAEPSAATQAEPKNSDRLTEHESDEQPNEWCWSIEPQAEIHVWAVKDGSIEIEQKSPLGEENDQHILVAAPNAVRLARTILYAAGFKNIVIATGTGGSLVDVEDGVGPHMVPE